MAVRCRTRYSADLLDHLDEFVHGISLSASELDQLPNLLHDRSALGRPGHGGPATAAKFEQPLVLKQPQRAQDCIRIDSENGREVSRRREPLTGLRLSVGYRSPNLGGDLLIEVGSIRPVHLDSDHCTSNTSSNVKAGRHDHFRTTSSALRGATPDSNPLDRDEIEALVEALIEEARQETRRRHRRYWAAAAVVAFVSIVVLILLEGGAASQTASPGVSARMSVAGQAGAARIAFTSTSLSTGNRNVPNPPPPALVASELYVVNADGGDKRLLKRREFIGYPDAGRAVWSPDGRRSPSPTTPGFSSSTPTGAGSGTSRASWGFASCRSGRPTVAGSSSSNVAEGKGATST